jgi:hypothetical protein
VRSRAAVCGPTEIEIRAGRLAVCGMEARCQHLASPVTPM